MKMVAAKLVIAVTIAVFSGYMNGSDPVVVAAEIGCPSNSSTEAYWLDVRARADEVNGDQLAVALADCLLSPNPVLRDRVGYEVLTYWLRNDQLSQGVKRELVFKLQPWLIEKTVSPATPDPAIGRAFSALVLSELVRADTQVPFLSDEEFDGLIASATLMVSTERDYRGLDPKIGWIHALAHGSDLLWRLASHPGVSARQLGAILDAVASQYTMSSTPPFVFNESDRVARVVVAVASNPSLEPQELMLWLHKIIDPGELGGWDNVFNSVEGMYKLHNTKQLLRAVREKLAEADNAAFLAAIDTDLKKLP